jgi:hypothetical protein
VNHPETRFNMAAYLEGELDLTRRALLDAHLDSCGDCSDEFAEMRRTVALLRGLPDIEPPPFLVEKVMRQIREGDGRATIGDRIRDFVRTVVTPQVAIPAAALSLGLMMATGVVDPGAISFQGLGDEPDVSQPIAQIRIVPSRVVVRSQLGSAGRPPAVARAPQVRIDLPVRGAIDRPSVVTQVASKHAGSSRPITRWSPRSVRNLAGSNPMSLPVPNPGRTGPEVLSVSDMAGVSETVGVSASAFQTPAAVLSSGIDEPERNERRTMSLNRRLEAMIHQPALFSADFAGRSIAEQEIWLRSLAQHAREQGRGQEVMEALRDARDPLAQQLAIAFAAELRRAQQPTVASLATDAGEVGSR